MGRLNGIDALRGIAALCVVVFCHPGYVIGPMQQRSISETLGPIFTHAEVAVDLFFVISGFVFTHVYGGKPVSGARFALARFARLFPLHIVTLLVTAAMFAVALPAYSHNGENDAYHFILNLLMLQGFGLERSYSFNSPAWSISVEVICYTIFWFVMRAQRPLAISAALAAAGLALCTVDINPQVGRGLAGFFAGVITYSLPKKAGLAIIAAIPIFALAPRHLVNPLLSLSAFPALVILLRHWRPKDALIWLGDRSYSIYLVHSPIFWAISIFILQGAFVPGWAGLMVFTLAMGAVLVISDISYRYLEAPSRNLIINYSFGQERLSKRSPKSSD